MSELRYDGGSEDVLCWPDVPFVLIDCKTGEIIWERKTGVVGRVREWYSRHSEDWLRMMAVAFVIGMLKIAGSVAAWTACLLFGPDDRWRGPAAAVTDVGMVGLGIATAMLLVIISLHRRFDYEDC